MLKRHIWTKNGKVVTNLWPHTEVGHTDAAKKELLSLFNGKSPFDTPKPTKLIERIIQIATNDGDYILDFFSGSATTAHAVLNVNTEKGNGTRKFILVQLPEDSSTQEYNNLCEIGEERIRRVSAKIKEENLLTTQELDIGFRVLKCDTSNMKDVYYSPSDYKVDLFDFMADNIKEDRTPEDLLFHLALSSQVRLRKRLLPARRCSMLLMDS